ncbi:MAG: hypothetical protein KJO36_04275 [Acidimicrobiia bacterium]|nr:hypothetical protein [Acidimicrobiia bacterium]
MTPTPEMKAFLAELADLMEKHGVTDLEATEDSCGFYTTVGGIEVTIDGKWDDGGEPVREFCQLEIGRFVDRADLRKLAED